MNRWGNSLPPEDAYSRVTNADRFAPLHALALTRLQDLVHRYEVTSFDGLVQDAELANIPVARPTVRLIPANASAASLTIAFTTFPGLRARFGRWVTEPFPACGCDACDETLTGEFERFSWIVDQVVAGRFQEWIEARFIGRVYRCHEFWAPDSGRSGGKSLVQNVTAEMRRLRNVRTHWTPWTPRLVSNE